MRQIGTRKRTNVCVGSRTECFLDERPYAQDFLCLCVLNWSINQASHTYEVAGRRNLAASAEPEYSTKGLDGPYPRTATTPAKFSFFSIPFIISENLKYLSFVSNYSFVFQTFSAKKSFYAQLISVCAAGCRGNRQVTIYPKKKTAGSRVHIRGNSSWR
jgi:hypothetical protein